jgi:hypothetical protein
MEETKMGHEFDKLVEDVLAESSVKLDSRAKRFLKPAVKNFKDAIEKINKRRDEAYKKLALGVADVIAEAVHYESGDVFDSSVVEKLKDGYLVKFRTEGSLELFVNPNSLSVFDGEVNRELRAHGASVNTDILDYDTLGVKVTILSK